MSHRIAIYFAPDAAGPLWLKAAEWLGRDPFTGAVITTDIGGISRDELHAKTVSARRYAFHATINSPMRLADGVTEADLAAALAHFTAARAPVSLGPLRLARLDGFLALIPASQPQAITDLAADVVTAFEPYRAPLSADEKARRNAGGHLTPRQRELIDTYGYPYVLEQFQFHMTLTDRLSAADQDRFEAAALAHFGPLATAETLLDRLVLFHEPAPGAPFTRGADFLLSKGAAQ